MTLPMVFVVLHPFRFLQVFIMSLVVNFAVALVVVLDVIFSIVLGVVLVAVLVEAVQVFLQVSLVVICLLLVFIVFLVVVLGIESCYCSFLKSFNSRNNPHLAVSDGIHRLWQHVIGPIEKGYKGVKKAPLTIQRRAQRRQDKMADHIRKKQLI